MGVTAILVVAWIVQSEVASTQQFEFQTLQLCEAARDRVIREHARLARKNAKLPAVTATCSAF
jgi:hypothetical protein